MTPARDVKALGPGKVALLGHSASASRNHRGAVLESVLVRDAPVNTATSAGDTPLHFACAHGFTGIAQALLCAGADRWLKNGLNQTPEEAAESEKRGSMVELMRKQDEVESPTGVAGLDAVFVDEQRQLNKMLDEMTAGQQKQSDVIGQLRQKLIKHGDVLAALDAQHLDMNRQLLDLERVCGEITELVNEHVPRETAHGRFGISRTPATASQRRS